MIVITKRNSIGVDESKLKFYKCECHTCDSEFYFSSMDITSEKRPNGKKYLKCPVCNRTIFISPKIFRPKNLNEITEEEYKKVIPKKEG